MYDGEVGLFVDCVLSHALIPLVTGFLIYKQNLKVLFLDDEWYSWKLQ